MRTRRSSSQEVARPPTSGHEARTMPSRSAATIASMDSSRPGSPYTIIARLSAQPGVVGRVDVDRGRRGGSAAPELHDQPRAEGDGSKPKRAGDAPGAWAAAAPGIEQVREAGAQEESSRKAQVLVCH